MSAEHTETKMLKYIKHNWVNCVIKYTYPL